jgi:hypothetical protein
VVRRGKILPNRRGGSEIHICSSLIVPGFRPVDRNIV